MLRIRIALAAIAALVVAGTTSARPFPEVVPLPAGFQPEGIAVGHGTTFYVGSIPTGAIHRGDLRTGEGSLLVPPVAGRQAIGLAFDRGRLFVAGGPTGSGFVYDARTGALLASYAFATAPTFVNDVVVTRDAAWFTDSFRPQLYRVPLSRSGALPPPGAVETVPLGGDFAFVPGAFNANGIDATPNGKTLVIVQSVAGALYTVDPATGEADRIELTGGDVAFGDGILLDGKTLYVVQNQLHRVAVVELSPHLSSGRIVDHLTDPRLAVPTTIAEHGNRLYAVNARFGEDPATADYAVIRLRK